MRVHLLAFPHTRITTEFSWCAYTQKVRRLADMLSERGHETYVYGGGETCDAKCTEYIEVIHESDWEKWWGGVWPHEKMWVIPDVDVWDITQPWWVTYNERAMTAIRRRCEPGDVISVAMGVAHEPMTRAFPDLKIVETGIGYQGTFAPYRVYESWAWRNFLTGKREPHDRVRAFDTVIPNSFHVDEFPVGDGDGGYYAYVGRMVQSKGPHVAAIAAKAAGVPLLVAGQGVAEHRPGQVICDDGTKLSGDVEYIGVLGPEARTLLMQRAIALFAPTLYLEPFGGVSVEAQLCGTPAICSNWGAFPENVIHGQSGYLCDTLADFVWAVQDAPSLKREEIATHARARWSTETISYRYDDYLQKLALKGWYDLEEELR